MVVALRLPRLWISKWGSRNGLKVFAVDQPDSSTVVDLRWRQQQDALPYYVWKTFEGTLDGLDPRQPVRVAARILGSKRGETSVWREFTLNLNPLLAPPDPPKVETGDGQVRLSQSFSEALELRWGKLTGSDLVDPTLTVWDSSEPFLLQGLDNDQRYGFQTARPGGGWSTLVSAIPKSHTAPEPPTDLEVKVASDRVDFSWPAGGEGTASYRLYCLRRQDIWRLPLRPPASARTASLEGLLPGDYRAFITSVGGAGHESRPALERSFSISESAAATSTPTR